MIGDFGADFRKKLAFVHVLERLARDNDRFEGGARSKADFDRWAPSALEAVLELLALTQERLRTAWCGRDVAFFTIWEERREHGDEGRGRAENIVAKASPDRPETGAEPLFRRLAEDPLDDDGAR